MKKTPKVIEKETIVKYIPKSLTEMLKEDNKIMSILKVSEIRHILAHTDKGDLSLMIRKDQTERDYRFVLDAVPLTDEANKELMERFNGVLFSI